MELDAKLKEIISECMADAQEYTHGKVNPRAVERWVDKVKKLHKDNVDGLLKYIYKDLELRCNDAVEKIRNVPKIRKRKRQMHKEWWSGYRHAMEDALFAFTDYRRVAKGEKE